MKKKNKLKTNKWKKLIEKIKNNKKKSLAILITFITGIGFALFFTFEEISIRVLDDSIDFGENEAARIGDLSISMEEFMLYAIDVKEGYTMQYGDDMWTTLTEDTYGNEATYEAIAKEDTFEQIRLIKSLVAEASEENVTITTEEKDVLNDTAKEYFETLINSGLSDNYMTQEIIYDYYEDNYIAQKMYNKLTGNTLYNSSLYKTSDETTEAENISADDYDEDELIEVWSSLIKEHYPDFDYDKNINWDLVDQLSFADTDNDSNDNDKEDNQNISDASE